MSSLRCSSGARPSSRLPSRTRLRMKSFLIRDRALSSISGTSVLGAVLLGVQFGVEAAEQGIALVGDDLLVAFDGHVEGLLELVRRQVAVHLEQHDLAGGVVDA